MTLFLTIIAVSLVHQTSSQIRPPNLSPDNLPETSFTCEDKVTGGYYADMEADCQLFHVCVQVSEYEFQDFHFLCPNDTVFDQQHLVCTNWFEVDCHAQLAFFNNDFGIKRGSSFEDEDISVGSGDDKEQNSFLGGFRGQQRSRNNGRGQLEVGRRRSGFNQRRFPVRHFEEYEDNEEDEDIPSFNAPPQEEETLPKLPIITGSTPIPLGFTTTIRPAGRSGIIEGGFLSGRSLRNFAKDEKSDDLFEKPTEKPTFKKPSFSKFGRDGRRPKVKSNIRANKANGGGKKNFFKKSEKPRKKSGRRVNLDQGHRNKIEFVEPREEDTIEEPFSGPQVRPDGRPPRVKANKLRAEQNKGEFTTVEPFVDHFFASPSSPKPFIFQGSPTPRSIRSTSQPFFIPTVKSGTSLSSQSPHHFSLIDDEANEIDDSSSSEDLFDDIVSEPFNEEENARNRFVTKNNDPAHLRSQLQGKGRHRISLHEKKQKQSQTEEPPLVINIGSIDSQTPQNNVDNFVELGGNNKPQKPQGRQRKKKFRKKLNPIEQNNSFDNEISSDNEAQPCSNPFQCPNKFVRSGGRRRPRVKSNVRAKKRNFWQKQNRNPLRRTKVNQLGVGHTNRKIRRGRKQVPSPKIAGQNNNIIKSDENPSFSSKPFTSFEVTNFDSTETFVPTARTTVQDFTTTESTTTSTEATDDDFDDFFDQENDLFIASSTVSSVVYKGSPTPGIGFFSSPNPWDDDKVSGASPSPWGHNPGRRPSFNDIGAHIDLGPKRKILEPEQLHFISSTVSNKIFIGAGDTDVSSTTPLPIKEEKHEIINIGKVNHSEDSKTAFPSFPIRGGGAKHTGFPFRPKHNFPGLKNTGGIPFSFTREKPSKKKNQKPKQKLPTQTEEESDSLEDKTTLTTDEIVTATVPSTTTRKKPSLPIFSTTKKVPRVKSNLLFNRKSRPSFRNKFARKLQKTSTTTTTTESSVLEDITETDSFTSPTVAPEDNRNEVVEDRGKKSPFFNNRPKTRFPNKRPQGGFRNGLFKKHFGFNKFDTLKLKNPTPSPVKLVTEEDVVTEAIETVRPNLLSVESELFDDAESSDDELKPSPRKETLLKPKRKKWPPAKKLGRTSANSHIRVDFKKAVTEEEEPSAPKNIFVKPDGRKPRVKSNIRARFAHRGKSSFGEQNQHENSIDNNIPNQEEETFDGSSTHLDVTSFQGSKSNEEDATDNTKKREIRVLDAPLPNIIAHNEVKPAPAIPVILNTRQEIIPPPLPTAILNHVRHITSIGSLPPLPKFNIPSKTKHSSRHNKEDTDANTDIPHFPEVETTNLLEKMVVKAEKTSLPSISTENHIAPRNSPATSLRSKLSAFRALQSQTVQQTSSSEVSSVVIQRDPSSAENADQV